MKNIIINILTKMIRFLPGEIMWAIKSNNKTTKSLDYDNEIKIIVDSRAEYKNRLNSSSKEPELIDWIESNFKKDDVFFDIGANVGTYSLIAFKYLKGDIIIYSFEPGFMNFSRLCENIMLNNAGSQIKPLSIPLSNNTQETDLNYNNIMAGYAHQALGEPKDFKGDEFQPVFKQTILSYKLDELIETFKLPIPNHLKIDVDGIEYDILCGAKDTLCNKKVRSVYIEIQNNGTFNDFEQLLRSAGLELESKHPHFDDHKKSLLMHNCIFKRKQ